ncbi:adenylyltransferase/cytidyltransferase family protein [Patescibacteria group bacterium]|nr:adenylyltransferase/cytidyltransferase family protein [Patescibacteria group bacterium]MBU1613207.1 adenylyltransferase/cytidyltransferase family protein [Patescibacteria group bacterium]
MKKVIVFGTFDKLHPGHIHMLKEAGEYGYYLIVVIARDKTVCEVKGREPTNDEIARLQALKDLGIADKVRLGCLDDNKYLAISEEKPDIVALGYDQKAFVDNLADAIDSHVQIVRLAPYMPEKYKSSLM